MITADPKLIALGEETLKPARLPQPLGERALAGVHWLPDVLPFSHQFDVLARGLARVADFLPDNGHDGFPGGYR